MSDHQLRLDHFVHGWRLKSPFVTSQESVSDIDTLQVRLSCDGFVGRGEALGVDYLGETPESMGTQLEQLGGLLPDGLDGQALLSELPAGGARNALDCALWDLNAKRAGRRVWDLLDMSVASVTTAYTLSLADPDAMAAEARANKEYPVLKLKLGVGDIADSVAAIRSARPDAMLLIDANGAWSEELLNAVGDVLARNGIAMLEQPLPRGGDQALLGLKYPVKLCADESCQAFSELEQAAEAYQVINIKLDKCGGLTEALAMQQWCKQRDLETMVGNMLGSSLAMSPAFLVAQGCAYVDLDGPLWQVDDLLPALQYAGAVMTAPESDLWG